MELSHFMYPDVTKYRFLFSEIITLYNSYYISKSPSNYIHMETYYHNTS